MWARMPLAYYSRAATQEFWSEHWADEDVHRLVHVASASPLTALIEAALPPTGRILEAGCGLGQYVILLRERGRAVTGADWSLDALSRCKAAAPSAPLAVMDLRRLAVKTGVLAAYISLGVVEHDEEGPGAIVAEAARVLARGGSSRRASSARPGAFARPAVSSTSSPSADARCGPTRKPTA